MMMIDVWRVSEAALVEYSCIPIAFEVQCIGGATVAYDTPGLDMLEGRSDLAVLWDIRVVPAHRRHGVGAELFKAAETWALERQCRQLKVETQNVNVTACRFYARRGCVLRAAHRQVYPRCPAELQLLWYKDLPWVRSSRNLRPQTSWLL